ncbi:5'-hydroxyaverantin dehydrogenase [Colletotrichum orbiculare MAFF 240422]|uniref:5'-hydroxyaverantin dehydrogenase n=1 Tax=Colletotrichum orbiculare (strain 104-T / ATCC 96160 / CBS 514.97 / LARS 414 / MAFF 240422) TaxID=1213857 RepID=A0A484FAQ4_COLOR|nr:5'-hydroxyaverantin dehydrogenase [Colletotrichum orbiculare MAFF 240422]
MPLPRYTYTGPVDHTTIPDRSQVKGKSVIITGGANGMGEACVRAFVESGAFVTFGDVNPRGKDIERELNVNGERSAFVECDIRDWDQQKVMFETAKGRSPNHSVDIVIANAGISRSSGDSLWNLDDPAGEPTKPNLNIVDVNLKGSLYTWKLAVHYFRQQPESDDRDRCFIITGSMVGWIDSPGNWEYTATKYGLHGFMKTARRSSWERGIRITYVAPCWIRSAIRTAEYEKWLVDRGVEFGEQEDVANCMMRVACDKSINGRSLMITPRTIAKEGFMDIDRDDYKDVAEDKYFKKLQEAQLVIIEDEWRDNYKVRARLYQRSYTYLKIVGRGEAEGCSQMCDEELGSGNLLEKKETEMGGCERFEKDVPRENSYPLP